MIRQIADTARRADPWTDRRQGGGRGCDASVYPLLRHQEPQRNYESDDGRPPLRNTPACSATGCADRRVTGLAFAAQALATRFSQNYEKGPTLPNDFLSACIERLGEVLQ